MFIQQGLQRADLILDETMKISGRWGNRKRRRGVGTGDEQVCNEAIEPFAGLEALEDEASLVGVQFAVGFAAEKSQESPQNGDRRPEFMADLIDEFSAFAGPISKLGFEAGNPGVCFRPIRRHATRFAIHRYRNLPRRYCFHPIRRAARFAILISDPDCAVRPRRLVRVAHPLSPTPRQRVHRDFSPASPYAWSW